MSEYCSISTNVVMDPMELVQDTLKDTVQDALKNLKIPNFSPKMTETLTETLQQSFLEPFKPQNNKQRIENWSDVYFYFPHLRTEIPRWKAQFVSEISSKKHRFRGCANPAALAYVLIPSVEDVIADDLKFKRNLDRNYHKKGGVKPPQKE